jgi:hypothetical protein
LYRKEIRPLIINKTPKGLHRENIKIFLRYNMLSDEDRKELWVNKIGNKLRISKSLY